MIGIAGLTFAVAVGRERFGRAATEAPDVSGTPFNPWVSIASNGEISIMAPAPLNAVASVSAAGDAAEVWCGTQYPTAAQAAAARALDIQAEKVKLNYTLLGGGFGRRGDEAEEFVVDGQKFQL
jgi:hypothetical protein